jgi:hypothetical protein
MSACAEHEANLNLLALTKLNARFSHSFAQHVVDKQPIKALLAPFLEFDIFERVALEKVRRVPDTYLGPVEPQLLLDLQILKLPLARHSYRHTPSSLRSAFS